MNYVIHQRGICPSPGSTAIPLNLDIFDVLILMTDVQELVIYGSWVRLLLGHGRPTVRDLDLLIVGPVDRRVAYEGIRLIESHINLPIDSAFLLLEEVSDKEDPFLAELFLSPHIHLGERLTRWTQM